jgi:hypothetical protein
MAEPVIGDGVIYLSKNTKPLATLNDSKMTIDIKFSDDYEMDGNIVASYITGKMKIYRKISFNIPSGSANFKAHLIDMLQNICGYNVTMTDDNQRTIFVISHGNS